jgi:hypothetical protein
MSAENQRQLQNLLAVTWVRPPFFSIHSLAIELAKRADADLTDEELRAASGAIRAVIATAEALAPEAERDPVVRADEHREFVRMVLALVGSPSGRKHLAEFVERVRHAATNRRAAAEAAARARRLEEQMRREAELREQASRMSAEEIVSRIEQDGYTLAVGHDGKLLGPKSLPIQHRIRLEVRRNEVIEFLRRRAEQSAAVEEV